MGYDQLFRVIIMIRSILALTFVFGVSSVYAEDIPKNLMPMTQVLQKLQSSGYNVVKKIEYNDDKYEATALNVVGEEVKLEVAPVTGEIMKPERDKTPTVSIFDAAQKVETAGYKNIYYMNVDKDKYEVKAYNKEDKKVSLDVDAQTGAIKE